MWREFSVIGFIFGAIRCQSSPIQSPIDRFTSFILNEILRSSGFVDAGPQAIGWRARPATGGERAFQLGSEYNAEYRKHYVNCTIERGDRISPLTSTLIKWCPYIYLQDGH